MLKEGSTFRNLKRRLLYLSAIHAKVFPKNTDAMQTNQAPSDIQGKKIAEALPSALYPNPVADMYSWLLLLLPILGQLWSPKLIRLLLRFLSIQLPPLRLLL